MLSAEGICSTATASGSEGTGLREVRDPCDARASRESFMRNLGRVGRLHAFGWSGWVCKPVWTEGGRVQERGTESVRREDAENERLSEHRERNSA